MRIDYSEPKKSCSAPQITQNRPRKESSSGMLIVVTITAMVSLGIGFASGWMLSQRSAKEGFKAAMAQQSFENSPQPNPPIAQPQPIAVIPTQLPQVGSSTSPTTANDGAQATVNPPLSFYKTLPSGQKNNVMGSGINTREDKPGKPPLQAAMPANLSKPAIAQNDDNDQKQVVQSIPAKSQTRADSTTSFTVQVASYSLKSEAEVQRAKLAGKGYNASIVESHQGDKGIWYRVRVGKRLDSIAAKELAAKLGKGAITIPDRE